MDGSPPGSPVPGILQGKSTEVRCHFLLQCVKVKLLSRVHSSRPHGLHPTRFLRPWDFSGKSTEVGCHFLLQVIFPKADHLASLQSTPPSKSPGYLRTHFKAKSKGLRAGRAGGWPAVSVIAALAKSLQAIMPSAELQTFLPRNCFVTFPPNELLNLLAAEIYSQQHLN